MNILAIFDNDGETLDRYTIVLNEQNNGSNSYEMLGVSKGGDGFSQFTYGTYEPDKDNSHLGKRIDYSDLDYKTAVHIAYRLCGEDR